MKSVVGSGRNTPPERGSEFTRIGLKLTTPYSEFRGDCVDADLGMPTRLWHTPLIVGPLDFERSIAESSIIFAARGHSTAVLWHDSDASATDHSGIECLPTVVDGGVTNGECLPFLYSIYTRLPCVESVLCCCAGIRIFVAVNSACACGL